LVKTGVSTLKVQCRLKHVSPGASQRNVQDLFRFPQSHARPPYAGTPADDKCHPADRILPLQHRIGEADQVDEKSKHNMAKKRRKIDKQQNL